jgi:hypothetical protein
MIEAEGDAQTDEPSVLGKKEFPYSGPIPKADILKYLSAEFKVRYKRLDFLSRAIDRKGIELEKLEECIYFLKNLPDIHPHAPVIPIRQIKDIINQEKSVGCLSVVGLRSLQPDKVTELVIQVEYPILVLQPCDLDYRMWVGLVEHKFPDTIIAAKMPPTL